MNAPQGVIVWFPGVGWEAVAGTDRRIVAELAAHGPVVWLDPADRGSWSGWLRGRAPAVTMSGNVTRVRVPATIGVTRRPMRALTHLLRAVSYHRAVRRASPQAVVVANPITRFPRTRAPKVLFVTDDWIAGAQLMGFDRAWVARVLRHNVRRASAIAAVSRPLLDSLGPIDPDVPTMIIPNGAPDRGDAAFSEPEAAAGLIGQINERLDLDLLEAVVEAGVPLRVVGPYRAQDEVFTKRWDRLVARPEVDWRGPVPASEVAHHLAEVAVGLTPYALSAFNRASSPLKTLEYLAAGVGVVSSDLPASRWLDTPDVVVCENASAFGAAVRAAVARPGAPADRERRRRFARRHSWAQRARDMRALIVQARGRRTEVGEASDDAD